MYIYTFAGLSIVLTANFYAKSSEKLEEEFDNTTKNKGYRIGLTTMTLSTSLPLSTPKVNYYLKIGTQYIFLSLSFYS